MKRNSILLLMAVLLVLPIFALSGCGGGETVDPQPPEPPDNTAQIAYQDAKVAFEGEYALFDFDRYDIRMDAATVLDAKGDFLMMYGEVLADVQGHCDERGTEAYNMALGDRRAHSATNYVMNKGVIDGRLSPLSFGESQPMDMGHNEEAWQANRRAQFVITADQASF